MNQLKSTNSEDASEAIVVSFDVKSGDLLTQQPVTRVFRKRAPRYAIPRQMYVYIGAPVSALIGRCEISALDWLTTKDALAICSEGAISRDELRRYASEYEMLAVYTIHPIEVCQPALSFSFLRERFSFLPPQSFFVLSRTGQHDLDDVAGFARRSRKSKRQ